MGSELSLDLPGEDCAGHTRRRSGKLCWTTRDWYRMIEYGS